MKSRPIRMLGALLLLATPATATLAAQERPQIDPVLNVLARPDVREAVRRATDIGPDAPREQRPLAGAVALHRGPNDGVQAGVFVWLRRPVEASLTELRGIGAEIGTVAGRIATARVPIEAIGRLGALDGIDAVTAARPVTVDHDSSMTAIGADEVRAVSDGVWTGNAGHGMLIGVYDTGIDYRHPDFRDGERPRVVGIWDQTAVTQTEPPGYSYGDYCDERSIRDESCGQRDLIGHGTHVAGSAAGDGSSTNDHRYAGVAPGADLLVVKGGNQQFSNADIVDGVAWMFEMAERRGQPIVVNLSLGHQFGPHDGTSAFSQILGDLTGPGRILVAAAGNVGANGNTEPEVEGVLTHAMATVATGETATFTVEVPEYSAASDACNDIVFLELWYEGGDSVEITVTRPDGSSASAGHGERTVDSAATGEIFIENAFGGAHPGNDDFPAFIIISDCGSSGAPESGEWRIQASGTAVTSGRPVHLWIPFSVLGENDFARGRDGFDNRYVVGAPATARDVIATGAFVTRLTWPVDGGSVGYIETEEIGDLARFSSAGPSRDGRIKPEITAPGLGIMSVLSSDASFPSGRIGADGRHAVLEGTSMASPHVAGTIALMLRRNGNLSPSDVASVFSTAAAQDGFTSRSYAVESSPDPSASATDWWGYGKLDVPAALDNVNPTPSTLFVDASPLAPSDTRSAAGTTLPLVEMRLYADGGESVLARRIGLRLEGADPEAMIELVLDDDRDGVIDAHERVIDEQSVELGGGEPVDLDFESDRFVIPAGDTLHVLAAIRLSGRVPNGATFRAEFLPDRMRTLGLASGDEDRVQPLTGAVAGGPVNTTVLAADQTFSLSENPVRSDRLVFNFAEPPTVAAVYSIDGRRVRDLLPMLSSNGLRVEWDLQNADGGRVAPGVYLAVFEVGDELIREKIFIVRGATTDDSEE